MQKADTATDQKRHYGACAGCLSLVRDFSL